MGMRAWVGAVIGIVLSGCGSDHPGPAPERLVPAEAVAGASVGVRIEGRGFMRRTTVDAVSGDVAVQDGFRAWLGATELGRVAWQSATALGAEIPATLGLGAHTLRLVDPFGREASLADAFRVVEIPPATSASATGAGGAGGADTSTRGAGMGGAPASIVIEPLEDGWLRQQFPAEIHFTDTDLRSGSGSTTNRANRTVMRFDLVGFAPGCAIASARLRLYYFADGDVGWGGVSPTLEVHRVTAPWAATANWMQRETGVPWNSPGGDFDAVVAASATVTGGSYGWIEWEITPLVKTWCQSSVGNNGLILLEGNDAQGNQGRKRFFSREAADASLRPRLEIATP
jgi:hypothetical protein